MPMTGNRQGCGVNGEPCDGPHMDETQTASEESSDDGCETPVKDCEPSDSKQADVPVLDDQNLSMRDRAVAYLDGEFEFADSRLSAHHDSVVYLDIVLPTSRKRIRVDVDTVVIFKNAWESKVLEGNGAFLDAEDMLELERKKKIKFE